MNKIIKIHGCSGAGKTTAVRALMNKAWSGALGREVGIEGLNRHYNHKNVVEAYYFHLKDMRETVYVLGSYENNCGGMDTVPSAAEAMLLIEKYAHLGHVIHEGLLQSTYYGAMGKHSQQYGDRYIYAFLDTPIDVCLERVVARRAASGRNNKFDPQLTRDKHATIMNLKDKLYDGRIGFEHKVAFLYHKHPMGEQLLELLK